MHLKPPFAQPGLSVQPWLPPFTQPGQLSYSEGTPFGSKFVEVTHEAFAPLHSYASQVASPFAADLACACGSKNVDGECLTGGSAATLPFWAGGRMRFQSEPYELIPKVR